jgi:hypothetical protein
MLSRNQNKAGFTRMDLAAILAGLGLAAIIALPALATNISDSHRSVCANNLRQLGVGFLRFMGDTGGRVPWRTPLALGGSQYAGKAGRAWFEFSILSNDVSPRVITCPADMSSDPTVRVSNDWGNYIARNRENSTSYQLALDVNVKLPEEAELLLADRNTRYDSLYSSCSSGISNARGAGMWPTARFGWTNAVHGLSGHILQMDGAVEFASTERLRKVASSVIDIGGDEVHMLPAR